MNNLTEQWKKGELPEGWYYIKCEDGEYIDYYEDEIIGYETKAGWRNYNGIEKVLAEVPSYEQWQELIESEAKSHLQADSYYNKILELKELLKECYVPINEYSIWDESEILHKISEALGEE